jgi:hypothetical protein
MAIQYSLSLRAAYAAWQSRVCQLITGLPRHDVPRSDERYYYEESSRLGNSDCCFAR